MILWKKAPEIIVALEIGTHKVAVAAAEIKPDQSLIIRGVGEAPSKGVRKGEIVDYANTQQAVREAITQAEHNASITIGEVYIALTGSHLTSRNVLVKTHIEEPDALITLDHIQKLNQMASDTALPADHQLLHVLSQFYYLDQRVKTLDPVGQITRNLEASYHLISGIHNRLETQVACVADLGIEVSGFAVSSYATAQAVLSPDDKELGSVVIDLGAGITDYIVYVGGAIVHTGTLGIGGDHLTQDLALGLKLPYQKAEDLKLRHGLLHYEPGRHPQTITLPRDTSFDERTIWTESLAAILHARQQEILQLIHDDLDAQELWPQLHGRVFLTGGASRINGLIPLASATFPLPCVLMHDSRFEGDTRYSRRPELATVLGLLRFAQNAEQSTQRPRGLARLRHSIQDLLASMNLL